MVRLLKLSSQGFKGKVTINFDGSGPKDIIEQKYQTLEQIDLDERDLERVEELWERRHSKS